MPGCINCVQGSRLQKLAQIDGAALTFMHKTAERLGWSARGVHRTLRVAHPRLPIWDKRPQCNRRTVLRRCNTAACCVNRGS